MEKKKKETQKIIPTDEGNSPHEGRREDWQAGRGLASYERTDERTGYS